MHAESLSCVCVFVTPWTITHQATLSMELSRQEYWNGLPLPPPRDLPDPGIKPVSPASSAFAGKFFTTEPQINAARRNTNNLRYADDTTLMAESEEELKSLSMKVKEESENVGLKLNIQKTKTMASGPIPSWQTDGETVETVADFIFWGSKITADGDCSCETKRRLLLGRKAMTNVDSIFKSRDITNKGPSSQSYGFFSAHVWM